MATQTTSKIFPAEKKIDTDKALAAHLADDLFAPAKRARERLDYRWYIYCAFRDGKQWLQFNRVTKKLEEPPSAAWREKPVINEIFIAARANNAVLTANKPRFEVIPSKVDSIMNPATGQMELGESVKNARKASKYLDYLFYRLKMTRITYEIVDDGFIFGNALRILGWNPDADDGLGEVTNDRISPFNFYPDPAGVDPHFSDHRFIDYVVPKDIRELQLRYPSAATELTADGKRSLSPFAAMLNQSRRNSTVKLDDLALLHNTWIRDPYKEKISAKENEVAERKIPLLDPNGQPVLDEAGMPIESVVPQEVEQGEELEVVRYKMKVVTWHNNIILEEKENPLRDGEYPFAHYSHEIVPGEFWADSGAKHAVDLNRNLNRRVAQTLENANRNNNPRLVIDEGSGIKKGQIPSHPGGVIRVRRGAKVEVLQGMNIARDSWDMTAYLDGKIQDLTATHDSSRGRVPQGVTSGRQLELLQSADATILSPKVEELEQMLSICGQKMLRRVADFYPAAKQGVILNSRGDPEEVDITPKDVDSTNVRVRIVSFLSMTKAARREELDKLLQNGSIDQQTYLEYYEFPDVEAIIGRTQAAREEKARLAAISGNQNGGSTPDALVPGNPQAPASGQTGVMSTPAISQVV